MTEASVSLRPEQMGDLVSYIQHRRFMNLSEPGTGKTPSVCMMQYFRWSKEGRRTIWIMPKSLLKKNQDESVRFTGFRRDEVVIVDGSPKVVEALLKTDAKVWLMGPRRFAMLHQANALPPHDAIDVDEIHMCFSGGSSGQTRAFINAVGKVKDVIIMTGTLVNGRLDTVWPAIHAIEPRYYPLGYKDFLRTHAVCDDYGRPIYWIRAERVGQILLKHGVRRTFKDVFGDQPIVLQLDRVDMHPKQREMYDEFEATAVLELEDAMIDGTAPGVALIRARQIMEHPNKFPDPQMDGQFIDLMPNELPSKLERLLVHAEDHSENKTPFIVFSSLRPQQRQVAELLKGLGLSVGLLDGETSAPQRADIDEKFRAGKIQCLVASPKVASVGFNWQFWGPNKTEVDHVIFLSLGYMDSDFIQAYRRCVRETRRTPLRVSVMAYKDSLDRKMMAILENKSRMAQRADATREVLEFTKLFDGERVM